jgi:hypothetical protein
LVAAKDASFDAADDEVDAVDEADAHDAAAAMTACVR